MSSMFNIFFKECGKDNYLRVLNFAFGFFFLSSRANHTFERKKDFNFMDKLPDVNINKLPQFIIPPDDIEIICNNNVDLIVDGQDRYLVDAEEPITIKRYKINARFIRLRKKGLRQLEKLGF